GPRRRGGGNVGPSGAGLAEEEVPAILREAAGRGAKTASYIMVRLPGPVEPLFLDWLNREFPARAAKVIHRLREIRSGRLSDSRFGARMRGEGKMAERLHQRFLHASR